MLGDVAYLPCRVVDPGKEHTLTWKKTAERLKKEHAKVILSVNEVRSDLKIFVMINLYHQVNELV